MTFSPRTYDQILADMIAYVQLRTPLSDFTVGSVIRTVLEAAALEDDEQYFQLVQLLEDFSISTATGSGLDRRLADFGITRKPAQSAIVQVQFTNTNLKTEILAQDQIAGDTALVLFSTSVFPTTGFPYTLRIGEGTPDAEDVTLSANNTSTSTLTVSTLLFPHSVGDRVSLVTGASSQTINSGIQIQVPPTSVEGTKIFSTTEPSFIPAGNFFSNVVTAKATTPGSRGNVGVGLVSQFAGSAPFSGAEVTNISQGSGGQDRETDAQYLKRALDQLQSLSRGTVLALESNANSVQDPVTKEQVSSSNVIEDFTIDEVVLYVDNGTGLIPKTAILPTADLSVPAVSSDVTLTLDNGTAFPSSGYVLVDDSVNPIVLYHYSSKTGANVLNLDSPVFGAGHNINAVVRVVEVLAANAEANQRRFVFSHFPIVRNSDLIWINQGSGWVLQNRSEYILNRGVGEMKLVSTGGVNAGSTIVANYNYYTNLVAQVQKVMEGDHTQFSQFPGVKAAGVFLSVEAPVIRRITVRMTITAENGFAEVDLAPAVQRAVAGYISSLRIGEDVIFSRLVAAAQDVRGVKEVIISTPTNSIVILENELPVSVDSLGNSLILVS